MKTLPLFSLAILLFLGTMLSGQNNDNVVLTSEVELLVFQIAKHKTVEEAYVGFAGTKSRQYSRYEELSELATEEELAHLTSHHSGAVRVYAFWALSTKDGVDLTDIEKRMKEDNKTVEYMSGCIISTTAVKDIYDNANPNMKTINAGGFQIRGITIDR